MVVVTLLRVVWPTEQVVFSAVNAVIGCWLVVASYVLGYDETHGAARNQVGVGLVILVLALTAAALSRRTRRPHVARR